METIAGFFTLSHLYAMVPLLTLLLGVFPSVREWVKKIWKKTLGRRGQQLDKLEIQLCRIEAELRPNGNSSIRDAIDRIEHVQLEQDAFLRAQLNLHDVAVVRTDIEGKLIGINRRYQRMTGYSIAEVSGDGWENAIHPDDQQRVREKWARSVNGKTEYHDDIKFLSAAGVEFMAHASVYREIDSNGNLRGYLGVIVPWEDKQMCPHIDACIMRGDA